MHQQGLCRPERSAIGARMSSRGPTACYAGAGYKGGPSAAYLHDLELGLQVAGCHVSPPLVEVPHPMSTLAAQKKLHTVNLEA